VKVDDERALFLFFTRRRQAKPRAHLLHVMVNDFDGLRRIFDGDDATTQQRNVKRKTAQRLAQIQLLGVMQMAALSRERRMGLDFHRDTNIPGNALYDIAHIWQDKHLVVLHPGWNRKFNRSSFVAPRIFVADHITFIRDGDDTTMQHLLQLYMNNYRDTLRFREMTEKRMVGRGGVEDVDTRTDKAWLRAKAWLLRTRRKRSTLKQILKQDVDADSLGRKKHLPSAPRLLQIILPALLWVREGFIRFRNLFELVGIPASVRMMSQRQCPVRLFDFNVAGRFRDPERLIKGHVGSIHKHGTLLLYSFSTLSPR